MMKRESKVVALSGRRWQNAFVLLTAAVFAVALPAGAQAITSYKNKKHINRPAKLDGYITLTSYYDDNVFSYSDSDITIYKNNAKPERFHIKQLDDIVTSIAARGDIVWSRRKYSYWRLRFRYDASLYQNNSFRNNNQFGVELRRKKRRSYTELSFLWTPNFYLRHLFWSSQKASVLRTANDPTYAPADFSKVYFSIEREQRLARRLYGRLTFSYAHRDYRPPFDERDNNTVRVGARLRKIFSRRFEGYVGASIASVSSSASNYNVPGIADVGNTETGFQGGFDFKLDRRGKLIWSESLTYKHQSYNTSDVGDVFHYNRADNEVTWKNRLTWRFHPHWQPRIFYTLRNSSTDVLTGVSDVGAFNANRFGLQIIHYF